MKFIAPIKISYKNLMAAKFRSFLTILGIIIGVASVIIVMSIGESAQRLVVNQVSGIGSNLIGILPGASDEDGPPTSALGVVNTTLKYRDFQSILQEKNVPNLKNATGYVSGNAVLKYKNFSANASYQGVLASFIEVENVQVEKGRFFTQEEGTNLSRSLVLGADRAEEIFKDQDPLGKIVTLGNINFTVVGVLEKRGSVAFSNSDNMVFVPLFTAQKILLGIDYLNFIRVKIDDAKNLKKSINDIKIILRKNHNIKLEQEDDFSVRDTAQAVVILTNITNVLKFFLVSIAAISLLVGGIGIMNIMLISVNQRIREVGLRKALGARNFHIIIQFLSESIFITIVGGLLGITTGIIISFLVSLIISALGYDWDFIISGFSIFLATVVSIFIGIIFGVYPAKKASNISPIEALRYE